MIKGNLQFDGLAIGKITADFTVQPIKLHALAAFVSSKTGQTHGWTKAEQLWSPDTLNMLKQLAELMERDLARLHLSDVDSEMGTEKSKPGLRLSGIAEHVGEDPSVDAPSV